MQKSIALHNKAKRERRSLFISISVLLAHGKYVVLIVYR